MLKSQALPRSIHSTALTEFDYENMDPDSLPWDSRIVGGVNAPAAGIAYQVSLRSLANAHFCGGSIISARWVLSAAHCTIGRAATSINVLVGTNTLNSGGLTHRSDLIRNHPNYNGNTIANDVSVVRVATPFVGTARVQSIALATAAAGGNVLAVLTGWGTTSEPGSVPNTLQWIQLRTLTNADCRSRFSAGNAALIFDHKICTFTQAGQVIIYFLLMRFMILTPSFNPNPAPKGSLPRRFRR